MLLERLESTTLCHPKIPSKIKNEKYMYMLLEKLSYKASRGFPTIPTNK